MKKTHQNFRFYDNRMNALLNYYKRRLVKKHMPLTWIFFITYKCNSKCKHCFYWGSLNKKEKEMSLSEIEKVALEMGKFDTLLLSGGEPTLRDDLPEICRLFYRINNVKTIYLPTNGLKEKKVLSCIKKILVGCKKVALDVSLPLEGFEKTNNLIRGIGAFRKTQRSIVALCKLKKEFRNLNLNVVTTVSTKNYAEIPKFATYVADLPVDAHRIAPIRGNPRDKMMRPPTSKQWNFLVKKIQANRNKLFSHNNTPLNVLKQNREISMQKTFSKLLEGKFMTRCVAGDLIGVMEANGDLRFCEMKEKIGNVRDKNYNLKKIWFSSKAYDFRKKMKRCTCTHPCFFVPSIDSNPLTLFRSLTGL